MGQRHGVCLRVKQKLGRPSERTDGMAEDATLPFQVVPDSLWQISIDNEIQHVVKRDESYQTSDLPTICTANSIHYH